MKSMIKYSPSHHVVTVAVEFSMAVVYGSCKMKLKRVLDCRFEKPYKSPAFITVVILTDTAGADVELRSLE